MRAFLLLFGLIGTIFAQYSNQELPGATLGYGNLPAFQGYPPPYYPTSNYQASNNLQPSVGSSLTLPSYKGNFYPPNVAVNLLGNPQQSTEGLQNIKLEDFFAFVEAQKNSATAGQQVNVDKSVNDLLGNLTTQEYDGLGILLNFFKNLGLEEKYNDFKTTAVKKNNTFLQRIINFVETVYQIFSRFLSILTFGFSDRIRESIVKFLSRH